MNLYYLFYGFTLRDLEILQQIKYKDVDELEA